MPPIAQEPETSKLYNVAVQDVQLPFKYTGVRCRLYYPTDSSYSYWHRHRRLPRDGSGFWWPSVTARGVAKYGGLPGFLGVFVQLVGGHIKGIKDAEMSEIKCGVVLFSHGLGGVVSGYCRLCHEVAKTGKVVVAVEHGEGSALGTVISEDEEKKRAVYFEKKGKGLSGDRKWRRDQVKKRVKEFEGVVRWLRDVSSGKIRVMKVDGGAGVNLMGKLDVETVDVIGHSFGGATAVGFAVDRPEIAGKVCVMDPWLWPMGADWIKEGVKASTKLLVLKNELSKMDTSQGLAKKINGENIEKEKVVLKGASHQIQTDFAYLVPKFLAKRVGLLKDNKGDPATMHRINNEICGAFCGRDWEDFKRNLVGDGKYSRDVEVSKL